MKTVLASLTIAAAAALAPPAWGAAAPAPARTSLGEAFFIQKDARAGDVEWFGSFIIWILLASSAASVAIIVQLSRETRSGALMPEPVLAELRKALRTGDDRPARAIAARDGSYLAQVVHATLKESDAGREAMLRALERSSEERAVERLRRIEVLSVIGAVAPMLGLFGTVYGIILAFHEIVASGGAPDPVGLASGIGTALVTTFWGLIAAIPALTAYALLRNALDQRTAEATLLVEDVVNHLSPRESGAPAAPAAARERQQVA